MCATTATTHAAADTLCGVTLTLTTCVTVTLPRGQTDNGIAVGQLNESALVGTGSFDGSRPEPLVFEWTTALATVAFKACVQ